MKIICEKQYEQFLKEKFKPFELLPITLVQQDIDYQHPAITFHIDQSDEVVEILKQISLSDDLIGEKGGRFYPLKLSNILFIEAFTKDTFAYTMDDFYRIHLKISDLEHHSLFTRISRTTLVNVHFVKFIVPTLASKLILHLENDMEIEVNRAYLKQFKSIIGMKVKK